MFPSDDIAPILPPNQGRVAIDKSLARQIGFDSVAWDGDKPYIQGDTSFEPVESIPDGEDDDGFMPHYDEPSIPPVVQTVIHSTKKPYFVK